MLRILRCWKGSIHTPCLTKLSKRHYMKVSEQMELLLKKSDQIPRDYTIIYREVSQTMPSFMYHTINFVTCTALSTIAVMMYKEKPYFRDEEPPEGVPIVVTNPGEAVVAFVFGALVVAITQVMRKRYPMRIYYNDKKKSYRVIFIGRIPFTQEFYEFPQKTVSYCRRDSLIPWHKVLFNANGRKIFLFEDKFRATSDLYQMMEPGEYLD
ncbi:hypothetical protein QAD02_022482 [Eretmocerus hayati]|uniref:Uncharacterized protein n=1 Tax=Eretmocerus hayati TaxID=131215 RepID=A0ACC2PU96_9HYME|nr:hypothetical protein QAD02_022482 [Eretmocerus hayati]